MCYINIIIIKIPKKKKKNIAWRYNYILSYYSKNKYKLPFNELKF